MATVDLHLGTALAATKGASSVNAQALSGVTQSALKDFARMLLWQLYDADKDRVLFTVNLLVFKKTFTVGDLAPLLTAWVGPHS